MVLGVSLEGCPDNASRVINLFVNEYREIVCPPEEVLPCYLVQLARPARLESSLLTQLYEPGDEMRCPDCEASLIERNFVDSETIGLMWMKGWLCPDCGFSVDPLPEHNRRLHAALVEQPPYGGLVLGGEAFTQYAF